MLPLVRSGYIILAVILTSGCSGANMDECVTNGVDNINIVKSFNRVFGNSSNEIGYYYGLGSTPEWRSKAIIYNRYLVVLSFDVKCDNKKPTIKSKPIISINEYFNEGEEYTDDGLVVKIYSHVRTEGESIKWKKINSVDDFFSYFEISPKRNNSVSKERF